MKIGVPSGIGDISWIVSKLISSPQWDEIEFVIADGWPYRADSYLREMLGKKCSYGAFQYDTVVMFERVNPYKTWADVLSYNTDTFYLQPNHELEKGKPLANWLPDLSTNYHYPVVLPDIMGKDYFSDLMRDTLWVGVSAASYRGHKAWKTWDMLTWKELLTDLLNEGYGLCFMGGSWDDLTRGLAGEMYKVGGDHVINLVGMTTFPEACAIHKLLPFFIGFSSGIGIIRSVMGLPTVMLWPEHQIALSESWADPADIISGRYVPLQYVDSDVVRGAFFEHIRLVTKEKSNVFD